MGKTAALLSLALAVALFPMPANAEVTFNLTGQYPADLTSFNLFQTNGNMLINYTICGANGTNATFHYKANDSSDCFYHVNGTSSCGYISTGPEVVISGTNATCFNLTINSSSNYIYPGTYNIDPDVMDNTAHINVSLGATTQDYFMTKLFNVSATTKYFFTECMYQPNPGATSLTTGLCNSSYTTGKVDTSPYCLTTFTYSPLNFSYNHTHDNQSKHIIWPVSVNSTTGMVGNVKLTDTLYIWTRGGSGWNASIINVTTRTDQRRATINGGTTWTNQANTADCHIHSYGDDERF